MKLEDKKLYYCDECNSPNFGEDWEMAVFPPMNWLMYECPVCSECWGFTDLEAELPDNVTRIDPYLPFCCGGEK